MLAPFVIFDLRHPPGLFTTTYFSRTPHVDVEGSSISMFGKILRNIAVAGYTMVRHPWLSTIFLVLSGILLSVDLLKKDFHNLRWLFPAIALIVVGVALEAFETRYFLAAIMFYLMWLFLPRVKKAAVLQKVILSFLILASIVSVRPVMTRPEIPPDIYTIRSITTIIRKLYADNPDIKNANITAVASDDLDMLSGKYRDLFSIYGISFRAASEYDASEHLFALSQSPEEVVRSSESYPLRVFGQTKLRGVYPVTNSDWKVYWFSY